VASRLSDGDAAWHLGHRTPRDQAIALGAGLTETLGGWLRALVPLYHLLAWTPDNDLIDANRALAEKMEARRRQAHSYGPGDRVRVLTGVFAGKNGRVESIDSKAQVKLRIGTMTVVLQGTDLTPA
jgi:hypothetical protein